MKVTGEQWTILHFLRLSRNVSGQNLLVYHILILIHKGAKLYPQRRANLKILNSAPGLLHMSSMNQEMGKKTTEQTTNNGTFNFLFIEIDAFRYF